VGQTLDVLIDTISRDGAVGRSKADAPEIDGQVQIHGKHSWQAGDFARVRVTATSEHDLVAEPAR